MVSILHAWQPYRRLHVAYGVMCLLLIVSGCVNMLENRPGESVGCALGSRR